MNLVYVQKEELVERAGAALNDMVAEVKDRPLLLLLSGGSSLNLINSIQAKSFGKEMTIGMLDDRYSREVHVNAFESLRKSDFYNLAHRHWANFIDSSVVEDEPLEEYAERYEHEIKRWIDRHPTGVIRATIGIGPDGHTSGVLPFPEDPEKFKNLFEGKKLVVGYDVGNKNPYRYRMTSTFTFIRKFDKAITYMSGEGKRAALISVLTDKGSLAMTPGRIIRELKHADIYTDIEL